MTVFQGITIETQPNLMILIFATNNILKLSKLGVNMGIAATQEYTYQNAENPSHACQWAVPGAVLPLSRNFPCFSQI